MKFFSMGLSAGTLGFVNEELEREEFINKLRGSHSISYLNRLPLSELQDLCEEEEL